MASGGPGPRGAPGRGQRRLAWLAVGALLACGLLVAVLWRVEPSDPAAAPEVVAAPAPVPAPPPLEAAAPEVPPEEDLPEPIRRFLDATPYPPTSGRLTRGHEDLLYPNRRHERERPIPESLSDDPNAEVYTLFTADRYYYTGDEPVVAWLEARRGSQALRPRIQRAAARLEGRGGPEGAELPFDLVWERDRFVAELQTSRFRGHHGPVVLEVAYEWEPGRSHQESLRLFVTPESSIPARFTGAFRDAQADGSLHVDVGIEVETSGFYRIDANVYDALGEPTAFVIFKGELQRAHRWVPLDVYGKVLRDAAGPGPWRVDEIRGYRFRDGAFPDRELMAGDAGSFVTAAHPLEAFVDDPHLSDHELHMVRLMLDDLERGISLDLPPMAVEGAPATSEADPDTQLPADVPAPPGVDPTVAPPPAEPSRR